MRRKVLARLFVNLRIFLCQLCPKFAYKHSKFRESNACLFTTNNRNQNFRLLKSRQCISPSQDCLMPMLHPLGAVGIVHMKQRVECKKAIVQFHDPLCRVEQYLSLHFPPLLLIPQVARNSCLDFFGGLGNCLHLIDDHVNVLMSGEVLAFLLEICSKISAEPTAHERQTTCRQSFYHRLLS